ncbi:acyl-CoA/acyl-ACP dehydrogenase [Spirulina major CS-329]|uniref:acyl-CoA dehydrogenase family protein n=1 Tax=Spirulina TaxID=1154 RepID=UPI002330A67B|nr:MULTISPECIES: acyl-CoA dehydrogenase family protein [Spirulina]MDB9495100.1 acyl-CoA/acyl-ACP dehydrogenase [Spirulina subsalsa CS-330]MDB9504593.1 acyl-CoA/acyl-ACP dehydrogenase [Spirulina major CS-329]
MTSRVLSPQFVELTPPPERMERDAIALRRGWWALGAQGWLAAKVATAWGGLGWSDRAFYDYQLDLTRHSGTLAFLQTQHQTAASFIANGTNSTLKTAMIPAMARGEVGVGVGYSHLRRSGEPVLRAMPVDDGYKLTGAIPWVTGWGIFDQVVVGATLPDGGAVFGLLPLQDEPGLQYSEPMPLAAMNATQTVSAQLMGYSLPSDRILAHHPPDWIHHKDRQGILNATAFALGNARSALDVIEARSPDTALLDSLVTAWQHLYDRIIAAKTDPSISPAQQYHWRGEAIAFAGRCAHLAITISKGAANSLDHPAQRIYREAIVFTVTGQTPALMAATVGAIAGR